LFFLLFVFFISVFGLWINILYALPFKFEKFESGVLSKLQFFFKMQIFQFFLQKKKWKFWKNYVFDFCREKKKLRKI